MQKLVNLYFELPDLFEEEYGGKYFALYSVDSSNWWNVILLRRISNIMMKSVRVWQEDGGDIKYIKSRYGYSNGCDLKEFFG